MLLYVIIFLSLSMADRTTVDAIRDITVEVDQTRVNAIRDIKVEVGEDVTIICLTKEPKINKQIPYWTINGSYYSSEILAEELPDYSLISANTMYIAEAKLWMDNTTVGCYYPADGVEVHLAILHVIFEFEGPADTDAYIGDGAFINCSSPLIAGLSVLWSINGLYYVPTELPPLYVAERDGLRITQVQSSMNGTNYQCLFQSRLLLKDYYSSDVGELTVFDNPKTPTDPPLGTSPFYFINRKFSSNTSFVTIYWTEPEAVETNCNEYQYFLVKSNDAGDKINMQSLGFSNHTSISRNDLMESPASEVLYRFHVVAMVGNKTCAMSINSFSMPRNISLQEEDRLPDSEYCIRSTGITCYVIWPKYVDEQFIVDCVCPCSRIDTCGCSNGDYTVRYQQEHICWSNLTHEMNRTPVFITQGEINVNVNDEIPSQNSRYIEAHTIVVADIPYSPVVTIRNNSMEIPEICMQDVYNGHNPITDYEVTIKDGSTLRRVIPIRKSPSNNMTCGGSALKLSSNCGPSFNINVTSRNDVGLSKPTSEKIDITKSHSATPCICFKENVIINMTIEKVPPNGVKLLMGCNGFYSNMESIFLNVTIRHHDSLTNRLIIDHKFRISCGGSKDFSNLLYDTQYFVSLSWEQVTPCTLDVLKTFKTNKDKGKIHNTLSPWIIAIIVIAVLFIILLTALSLCLILFCVAIKCNIINFK